MPGLLIYNASSGTAAKFPPARLLAELPAGTRLYEFAEGDDPVELGKSAVAAGVSWIAVAGGDGTVEAVASALVGTSIPLGVIPCGTYNNFARSAELPADPLEAARVVAAGAIRAVDVGMVNGRPFFECVGVGLDAALFPLGEEIKSGGFSRWLEFFRRAFRYPRQTFDLELDRPVREALRRSPNESAPSRHWRDRFHRVRVPRTSLRLRALMLTVSNGPYYGANFAVAPDARIDSGSFTVTIFKRYNKLELWWHFFSIRAGRRKYTPSLVVMKVAHLRMAGPSRLHVHADGSPLDQWPLELVIQPGALRLFAMPNAAGETPPDASPKT